MTQTTSSRRTSRATVRKPGIGVVSAEVRIRRLVVAEFAGRALSRKREVYASDPWTISACRKDGGVLARSLDVMDDMDARHAEEWAALVTQYARAKSLRADVCPYAVAEQAQADDMAEDVLEPIAMRDPARVGEWLRAKRKALASSQLALVVWGRKVKA